ncbi:MAG: hypothetical protein CVU39_20485 [Chloroflexi bacterium HGW-Chloroflexi-10]|nr:MAG: hypothetical protein CVU39_20485 [Chloroflexi bacterium HGW-Chloroflexi-10]
MNNFQNTLALILIFIAGSGYLVFVFFNPEKWIKIRAISAFDKMRQAIGLSIEQGKRLHLSLGRSNITEQSGAASLVALSTLEKVSQQSTLSDKPPVTTSGSGDLAILSQDIIQASYRSLGQLERYTSDRCYLTGATNFSYVAGTMQVIAQEDAATQLLIGNFGPEIALMTDAADRKNGFSFVATDNLQGQATAYACADELLLGEEMFAIPSFISNERKQRSYLHIQDILRWITISVLIIGSILKLVGVL